MVVRFVCLAQLLPLKLKWVFLVLLLIALPAQASYVQNIFDSDGTQIGTLEFATLSATDTSLPLDDVLRADYTFLGVAFTSADVAVDDREWRGTAWRWSIDPVTALLSGTFFWEKTLANGDAWARLSLTDGLYTWGGGLRRLRQPGIEVVMSGAGPLGSYARPGLSVSSVPVPPAAWLFVTALGVFGYLGKRKTAR